MDLLLAPNLEPRALEVFQTLETLDLKEDDRLYIFGYSRGAVIARVLAMCIASSKHLLSAARIAGFSGSIHAQIEFLCLFDPVAGRPRFYRSRVPNHDAILEPKVKNYLELLSAEEGRLHYPSDSYQSSRKTRKRIDAISPVSIAGTTEDRQRAITALNILKTRKAVWFPGKHGDVGGHGKNEIVGLHALATALQELEQISTTSSLGVAFPADEVKKILGQISNAGKLELEPKGFVSRLLHGVSRRLSKRVPRPHKLVQHFAHPLCKDLPSSATAWAEFAEYPARP